jgi:hypothetical protein
VTLHPEAPAARWFFEDAEAVQRLCAARAKWLGTAFAQNSKAPGHDGGIDCVGLLEEVLGRDAGVDRGEAFVFPRTSADYQSHRTELRVLKYLRGEYADDPQSARLARIFAELRLPNERTNLHTALFLPGDLLVLRTKREVPGHGTMFHLCIMTESPRFLHCAYPTGVQESNIHDPTFSKHIDAFFRARACAGLATPSGSRGPRRRRSTSMPTRRTRTSRRSRCRTWRGAGASR